MLSACLANLFVKKISTFLFGYQQWVYGSQCTQQGEDPHALVLEPYQVHRNWQGEIQGDGIQQGHAGKESLEESSNLKQFVLQLSVQ